MLTGACAGPTDEVPDIAHLASYSLWWVEQQRIEAKYPACVLYDEVVDLERKQCASTTKFFHHLTLACLRRPNDHFPHRLDQRTTSRDTGSGRWSGVNYTPNSRIHLSGQISSNVFNIDDAPLLHVGLEKEYISASISTAGL
ncbi:hypothetical protein CVT25_000488 [Psilocybe cyanescens]|uniref:Uncharacterized protein n=1 Tax=Psilocybe cyanescens TaxID=93625 RepID=A0A409XWA6_PSICY|nr:hypothetical protein CVT25_000488 [Psilocybe cyanescens]